MLSKTGKSSVVSLALILAALLVPALLSAAGRTTYSFVSVPLTQFVNTQCPPTCMITGSFTTTQPLPPNINLTPAQLSGNGTFTPQSWSFTDGVTTFTNLNSSVYGFAVNTDSNGNITEWGIYMGNQQLGPGISLYYAGPSQITQEGININAYQAYFTGPQGQVGGTWTTAPAAPYAYIGTFTSVNCCMAVMDTSTNAIVANIPITGLGNPFGLTPDNAHLYVADYFDNLVGVIDTASNTLTSALPVPGGPNDAVVTPNGKFVYVGSANGNVYVIGVATNTIVATIPVGFQANWVTVSPDGSVVYVSAGGNTIAAISTATNTVTSSFVVPLTAGNVSVVGPFPNPAGTLGYFFQVPPPQMPPFPGTVNVYSLPGLNPMTNISVGSTPLDLAVSPDGSHLYVPNFLDNTVSVIDATTNTVVATIPVGVGPQSLALTPDGSLLYLTNTVDGTVSVILAAANKVIATVPLTTPFGIVIAGTPPPSQTTALSLNPGNLIYGTQTIGAPGTSQTVNVTNPGPVAVTLTSVAVTGPASLDYLLTNNCPKPPATLAANATCTIPVSFAPLQGGTRTALLTIVDNNGVASSTQSVPLSGTANIPEPTTTTVPLTFNPGSNVSQVAVYNCPSGTVPCTDPNAHSLKLTVPQVFTTFTLNVTAYEVSLTEANGDCEAGQTETTDFDCRFKMSFPITQLPNGDVIVPQCDAYSNGNCVFYRVSNTPPFACYMGPVNEYIAWNNEAFIPPPIYQANNPRLFDDPDDPPYNVNHQFVFDITDYYQPNGQFVGVDAGISGKTLHFNDFVVAFPGVPSTNYKYTWLPPLGTTKLTQIPQGNSIVAKFQLTPDTPPQTAVTAPNHTSHSVLLDTADTGCKDFTGVRQPAQPPSTFPSNFTYDPMHHLYQLKLQGIYKPGNYKLLVDSNLFPEQCAAFQVTK